MSTLPGFKEGLRGVGKEGGCNGCGENPGVLDNEHWRLGLLVGDLLVVKNRDELKKALLVVLVENSHPDCFILIGDPHASRRQGRKLEGRYWFPAVSFPLSTSYSPSVTVPGKPYLSWTWYCSA